MQPIRLTILALFLGILPLGLAHGQSPSQGGPADEPQTYTDDRGYDDSGPYDDGPYDDDRYDDDRYDDDRYDEDRYDHEDEANHRHDDDRGYGFRPSPRTEVGFFYEELSPYGDWVLTRTHGWAWFPRYVHPDWRPYSDGRWVVTSYGWTWASNEPFGWATYHYGRWARDSRFGWLWVPGTIWGPAWVSWQHGGGYVGWAPLPPSVGFEVGFGIRLGRFNLTLGIRPDAYSFVPERSFLDSRLASHLIPTARNVTIIHNTTNITNYSYVDNRIVNRGVEVRRIEQATGRRVRALRISDSRSKTRAEVETSEIRIYRPERQKLESVRIGERANAGLRAEMPPVKRDGHQPPSPPRVTPRIEVKPEPVLVPRPGEQPSAQQERRAERERQAQKELTAAQERRDVEERRAKQELAQYQAGEKRRLAKAHQEELAKTQAQAQRSEVEKQHRAERDAMRDEQLEAERQLEARQKAQRRAERAIPPSERRPVVLPPPEKKKEKKGAGRPQKNDQRGEDDKPKPPLPRMQPARS